MKHQSIIVCTGGQSERGGFDALDRLGELANDDGRGRPSTFLFETLSSRNPHYPRCQNRPISEIPLCTHCNCPRKYVSQASTAFLPSLRPHYKRLSTAEDKVLTALHEEGETLTPLHALNLVHLLTIAVLLQHALYLYFEDVLQESHFPCVGSEDGPQSLQVLHEFGVFAEEVYAICIQDCQCPLRQVPDENGEELAHIPVSAQTRPNHPRTNRIPPGQNLS
jgi:hypothetical protein